MSEHSTVSTIRNQLDLKRPLVLVGLMGAGKTTIGRRLAKEIGLDFFDSDAEITEAAGCSISDIFALYGEAIFRDLEKRVLLRLVTGDPAVIATGGGAFMNPDIRKTIAAHATSLWLRAEVDVLEDRVSRRNTRPLLEQGDKHAILSRLMEERYPVYALADVTVNSGTGTHESVVAEIIKTLATLRDKKMTDSLRVGLGERSYDIMIGQGLLTRAGELLKPLLRRPRVIVVTDENVVPLYTTLLEDSLRAQDIACQRVTLAAGEKTKSFAGLENLMDTLFSFTPDRFTTLVALGGGVIGDITGFAASILLRGVDFVQIPTTLLAQVDSAVGGKTGINTKHGKNLVGSFYQPKLVIADISTFGSLPRRELLAGYAEVVKYGVINDASFFAWLEQNGESALAGDKKALAHMVHASCKAKADIVGQDERESGVRALLNFGHTLGHAFEAEAGYSDILLHGEAVSLGMVLALRLSAMRGLCSMEDYERVRIHLTKVGLPISARAIGHRWNAGALIEHCYQDKKARDGGLTFVLAEGIGKTNIFHDVKKHELEALLAEML